MDGLLTAEREVPQQRHQPDAQQEPDALLTDTELQRPLQHHPPHACAAHSPATSIFVLKCVRVCKKSIEKGKGASERFLFGFSTFFSAPEHVF